MAWRVGTRTDRRARILLASISHRGDHTKDIPSLGTDDPVYHEDRQVHSQEEGNRSTSTEQAADNLLVFRG